MMRNLYNWNSPWVQNLTLLTNLIILNFLWLICCIPVFTAGAATTALYYTLIQFQTAKNDSVLNPFFHAFTDSFKQATLFWIPILAALALLIFNISYLLVNEVSMIHWSLIIVAMFVVIALLTYLFPLIARYHMGWRELISTSISLFILHLPLSLVIILLSSIPVIIGLVFPAVFLSLGIIWIGFGFSFIAYLNSKLFLRIFNKHIKSC